MTQVKLTSTNQQNKQLIRNECPVTLTLEKIGGRWKPLLLFNLREGDLRYGKLRWLIPGITEKMLVQHLRELEADDLITRIVKSVVPPHVEYSLTGRGKSLIPLLNEMARWGITQKEEVLPFHGE